MGARERVVSENAGEMQKIMRFALKKLELIEKLKSSEPVKA